MRLPKIKSPRNGNFGFKKNDDAQQLIDRPKHDTHGQSRPSDIQHMLNAPDKNKCPGQWMESNGVVYCDSMTHWGHPHTLGSPDLSEGPFDLPSAHMLKAQKVPKPGTYLNFHGCQGLGDCYDTNFYRRSGGQLNV